MKLVGTGDDAGVGVTGTSNTGIGVRGTSNNIGVRGDGDGFGVVGGSTIGTGVAGSGGSVGVRGDGSDAVWKWRQLWRGFYWWTCSLKTPAIK